MNTTGIKIHVILLLVVILNACATGSSIVTGTVREPIDFNLVKLYIDPPEIYETIGIVKASSGQGLFEQDNQDYAVEELKKQAARLGANGVLITETGENIWTSIRTNPDGSIYSTRDSEQTISGYAIYVGE